MHKHAYMIIAHNEFDLLETLVRLLDDPRNDLYIHIDAKVQDLDFARFHGLVQHANLQFTPRRLSVTWGHSSQVMTELLLLQTAVAGEDPAQPYAYYHLISGVDLPIKSNDEIHAFFDQNEGKEFVHFSKNEPDPGFATRIRYYHLFRKKRNGFTKVLAQIAFRLQVLLRVDRLKGQGLIVQKGTNWFSITGDFAKYIVSQAERVEQLFAYSYCGDEVFVQTMLVNSPFAANLYMPNCNNDQMACARLIDWERGHPYVFRMADYDEIMQSPAMFARKFSMQADPEIVKAIQAALCNRKGNIVYEE